MEPALSQDTPSGAAEGSDWTRGQEGQSAKSSGEMQDGGGKKKEEGSTSKRTGDEDKKETIVR